MAADAGIDHVHVADHVSFRGGHGADGLIQAVRLLALDDRLGAFVGVYLLALRHPVVVARQLATIAESAPGRLIFGVGVGGDDRAEIEAVGVDPRTRGRHTDEALDALRGLLTGRLLSWDGEFFSFSEARILPTPDPPVRIVVGGRSDAAVRRAGRFGEGWLASWCSADRYAEAVALCEAAAVESGRDEVTWRHGYQGWIGVGKDRNDGRELLAPAMESFYRMPFAPFEKYCAVGTIDDIAGYLEPYRAAGCSTFNLTPIAPSIEEGVEANARLKALLA
jgi:alkanesulfonate monooxygenase SsuD/methylene tetrahydromethanopterin reductase-like flavin-dependent oxidoreductase (luciferase family)